MQPRRKFQRKFGTTYPANSIRVCVDSVNGDDLTGKFFSKMRKDPISFTSFTDLFLSADKLFDIKGYPQSFQEKRSFTGQKYPGRYAVPEILLDDETILMQQGHFCTFDILVQSRCRTGWQGLVVNIDGDAVEFQSELELLESVLEEVKKDRKKGLSI